jgi:DNA-cytosine methyltransferase
MRLRVVRERDAVTKTKKPPYKVPSMASIRRRKRNGLTVASTFSGAGGSCTGYEMAGLEVVWANEFEPTAAITYAANHPNTVLDTRDIRDVKGRDILDATGLAEIDVLDGSPPCQSFSMAGQRHKSWGREMDHADGTRQRADDLFFEFGRIVDELKPRSFVAENVAGLVNGVAKGMFKEIMAMLAGCGYDVEARLLDAQWLGVPQRRRRLFIVGMRRDLKLTPAFPDPLPYRYGLVEACPWIVEQGTNPRSTRWAAAIDAGEDPIDEFMVSSEEPSRTLTTRARRGTGHVKVTGRKVHDFGPTRGEVDVEDPFPTVVASGASINRFEIETPSLDADVRVTGRMWGKDRETFEGDAPFPTVIASGATQNRFVLERRARVQPKREQNVSWGERRLYSLDEPAPPITSEGIDGSFRSETQLVEVDDRNRPVKRVVLERAARTERRSSWSDKRTIEGDEPAPTITTDGIAGSRKETWGIVDVDARPSMPWLERAERDHGHPLWACEVTHEIGEDEPSPTINAAGIDAVRPGQMLLTDGVERRQLSIDEVKRICSFPDDYEMSGSYAQQWQRLGNSVPPVMMSHVARVVAERLLGSKKVGKVRR